jgi:hypothetical protein
MVYRAANASFRESGNLYQKFSLTLKYWESRSFDKVNIDRIIPSMSLTGLSLEMYIFHFEANSLFTHISGFKRPIFTNLGSLERPWPIDGSQRMSDPKMRLWSAPD